MGHSVVVALTRTGCPGAACTITSLAHTNAPMVMGGNGEVRYDLVVEAMQAMKGRGSASYFNDGTNLF